MNFLYKESKSKNFFFFFFFFFCIFFSGVLGEGARVSDFFY